MPAASPPAAVAPQFGPSVQIFDITARDFPLGSIPDISDAQPRSSAVGARLVRPGARIVRSLPSVLGLSKSG